MLNIQGVLRAAMLIALCAQVHADVAPLPGTEPVQPAFEASDVVCFCEVVSPKSSTASGVVSGSTAAATILVRPLATYKGTVPDSGLLSVESGVRFGGSEAAAVMFLRKSGAQYSPSNRFIGIVPFWRAIQPGSSGSGLVGLENALVDEVLSPNRDDVINALHLLHGFQAPSARSVEVLSRLADSPDPAIALNVIGILLKTNTRSSVKLLLRRIDDLHGDSQSLALITVGSDLGHITNTEARPAIESLAASKFLSIRLGAMDALRSMKSEESAPVLIGRLDDSDANIRYLAVISLAEIFGKGEDYAPSMYQFDMNPRYYTELWKAWWSSQGKTSH